jgi:hypothetical protein
MILQELSMGTWAEGNFDNDAALDLLADISATVSQEMSPPEHVEDVDLVMAAVAVRRILIERCHASRPERDEIEQLKNAVLSVYDAQIDGLAPDQDFKVKRRRVIEATFDGLLALLDA